MKCKDDCVFYLEKLDTCMFCSFVKANDVNNDFQKGMKNRLGEDYKNYVESVMFKDIPNHQSEDDFDILNLDDSEWEHKQVLNQLHDFGVDCYFVDMWDGIAYITGISSTVGEVARVLGLHRESIYYDHEHSFMILNLFQEKVLRENDT